MDSTRAALLSMGMCKGKKIFAPGEIQAYLLLRVIIRNEMEIELSQKSKRSNDLHPFVQVLSISDLDGCVAVENAAFPEDQRASREKV